MNPPQSARPLFRKSLIPALISIFLAGLLMRVIYGQILRPGQPGYAREHFTFAASILDKGIFSGSKENPKPTSIRMPLYAMVIAGIGFISGQEYWVSWTEAFQYLLGAFICVLIGFLGAQLIDIKVGLIAGFLAAFYTDLIYISIALLRENLSLFLLLVTLVSVTRFFEGRGVFWLHSAALSFGLGVLNRPEIFLIGILIVVFEWNSFKERLSGKPAWIVPALFLGLGPWAAWMARNFLVHGHWIPFSTDGAWVFYMGQVFHPNEAYTKADPSALQMIANTPVEYDWYRQMNQEAIRALFQHPLRNMFWAFLKIQATFQEYSRYSMSLFYPVLWVLIPGLVFKERRFKIWGITAGIILALVHLKLGAWDPRWPIALLHVGYSDIVLLGAVGFSLMILKSKVARWKLLAAPLLTLIVSVTLFIAHYRARIILCDWLLLLGTSYLLVELVRWVRGQTFPIFFSPRILFPGRSSGCHRKNR